jgi:4-hydroxy-tetrahydrodipicolinate synthase
VVATLVTPYTDNERIDFDGIGRLVEFHLEHGATGLCSGLDAGESIDLTPEERIDAARAAVEAAAGRVPVFVHASLSGTRLTAELARAAEKIGASAVLVTTPYYWRSHPQTLVEHFRQVGAAIGIPLIGYNRRPQITPAHTGADGLPIDTVVKLIETNDNFEGLLDTSNSVYYFSEARRRTWELKRSFSLMTGLDCLTPTMAVGGDGCFSPLSGLAPRLVQRLYEMCAAKQFAVARSVQFQTLELWQLLKEDYPASIKAAMALWGRPVGSVRGPLLPLSSAATAQLHAALQALPAMREEPVGW